MCSKALCLDFLSDMVVPITNYVYVNMLVKYLVL